LTTAFFHRDLGGLRKLATTGKIGRSDGAPTCERYQKSRGAARGIAISGGFNAAKLKIFDFAAILRNGRFFFGVRLGIMEASRTLSASFSVVY
jgi:hypothetical protein